MREEIADSGKDLHVLEGLLSAGVELLGIVADSGYVIGVFDYGVDVLVHLALHESDDAALPGLLLSLHSLDLYRHASQRQLEAAIDNRKAIIGLESLRVLCYIGTWTSLDDS